MTDGPRSTQRHLGVSLWRDIYDPGHWVLVLFGRWLLHYYDRSRGRANGRHVYWRRTYAAYGHLNRDYPEFKRVPV